MKAKVSKYRVVFDFDPAGWWIIIVPKVRGCHTQARSLAQGRRLIRDALSLFVDDAGKADLVEEIHLPERAAVAVSRAADARGEAELGRKRAAQSTLKTARQLERLGLSLRDAAELLGLSHQRIQQLLRSA